MKLLSVLEVRLMLDSCESDMVVGSEERKLEKRKKN